MFILQHGATSCHSEPTMSNVYHITITVQQITLLCTAQLRLIHSIKIVSLHDIQNTTTGHGTCQCNWSGAGLLPTSTKFLYELEILHHLPTPVACNKIVTDWVEYSTLRATNH